jgi:hypothetical protein
MMEIAMRISELKAALAKFSMASVLIKPEVCAAFDPAGLRTSGLGH